MDEAGKSEMLDSAKLKRKVLGIDINIRKHNRAAIDAHPLRKRIKMIQGSSKDQIVINQVKEVPQGLIRVIVFLDSIHTHTHVLAELEAYAPLTTGGCCCLVFDIIVEYLPAELIVD